MKTLLVAAATFVTGGAERHVADLLHRLPAVGIEIELCCPPEGDLPALASGLGIPVHPASIEAGFSAGRISEVRRAIDRSGPDLVHAHGSRAAFFARLADPQARQRVVYTVHGIHIDKAGSPLRRLVFRSLERALRGRTRHFVCVAESDIAKGEALGIIDPARANVLYNGIEPTAAGAELPLGAFRAELGIAEDVPLAVSVGRFHEQKDQRTLLRAWADVTHRMPDAVLALIGSGPLEGALRKQAAALQLGDSLRFVVPRQGLGAVYADADVFVLSSLWEGLPYVVLEAMDARLPVVTTAVDGIPEAVTEGVTGFLVPPADPAALADAVVTVLGDLQRARAMGEAGRARVVSDFALDRMTDAYVELYTALTAGD
jgi:glycosyltransferase involved in cell wall biosynthesis